MYFYFHIFDMLNLEVKTFLLIFLNFKLQQDCRKTTLITIVSIVRFNETSVDLL